MEVEQRLGAVAVVDQPVEGGEEGDAVGNRGVGDLGMRLPALRASAARRARGSASPRRRARRRAARPSRPRGYQRSARSHSLLPRCGRRPPRRHGCSGSGACSATFRAPHQGASRRVRRRVLAEHAGRQGAVALELAQDVALEARAFALRISLATRSVRGGAGAPPPHAREEQREVFDRPDEAFHSISFLSSQSRRSSSATSNGPRRLQRTSCCGGATVEIGSIWRKPSRRTVSRMFVGRAVEELRAYRDPARLLLSRRCLILRPSRRQRTLALLRPSRLASRPSPRAVPVGVARRERRRASPHARARRARP